jgi:hypothetical protein
MTSSRKKWGFMTIGLVAALSLGAIGVAGAATSTKATPAPSASAGAAGTHAPDGDHGDPAAGRGGLGGHGRGAHGGGDIAEALASLASADVSDIMAQRASGTSFADSAKAKGISTEALLAEATQIETDELDAAVKAGRLTEAQRTQILAGLQAQLKEELTETHAVPRDGGKGCDGVNGAGGAALTF